MATEITNPVTVDGVYVFRNPNGKAARPEPGSDMVLEVTGEFDGATVTPVWIDSAGNPQPFFDDVGTFSTAAPKYWMVEQPPSRSIGYEITGAGASASLTFTISPDEA